METGSEDIIVEICTLGKPEEIIATHRFRAGESFQWPSIDAYDKNKIELNLRTEPSLPTVPGIVVRRGCLSQEDPGDLDWSCSGTDTDYVGGPLVIAPTTKVSAAERQLQDEGEFCDVCEGAHSTGYHEYRLKGGIPVEPSGAEEGVRQYLAEEARASDVMMPLPRSAGSLDGLQEFLEERERQVIATFRGVPITEDVRQRLCFQSLRTSDIAAGYGRKIGTFAGIPFYADRNQPVSTAKVAAARGEIVIVNIGTPEPDLSAITRDIARGG